MLDPQIAALFSAHAWEPPLPDAASLPQLRQWMSEAGRKLPAPAMATTDHDADGVPVRLYRPAVAGPLPLLLFLHGGGWIQGDLDTHDAACRLLAEAAGCAVMAVEYRLAPEFPFPAPLDDCATAYDWACANAQGLGLDSDRIAIGGESAGANLSAAVVLRLRGSSARPPLFQFLIHPACDLTLDHVAFNEVELNGLTRPFLDACVRFYAGDADIRDPLISPLHEPDLSGLPPAIVYTVEVDPLRTDGEAFAARLVQDGNEVLVQRLPALPHGFMFLPATIPSVRRAFDLLGTQVARYFARI